MESRIFNKINFLERKRTDKDCFKEDKKELIKKKIILKTQQRLNSERHIMPSNVQIYFKSSNDDKRMPSIHSVETE